MRELTAERVEELVADGEARVRAASDQAQAATRDALDERPRARPPRPVPRMPRCARRRRSASRTRPARSWRATARARRGRRRTTPRTERPPRSGAPRELAVLVCGEARRLSASELSALRSGGPSGPAVLAAALRELSRARASGNGPALDAALGALASAAVRWRDRL